MSAVDLLALGLEYDAAVSRALAEALEVTERVGAEDAIPALARELVNLRRRYEPDARRAEITPAMRTAVFRRDGFQCVECAETNVFELTVDHRVPRALGGGNEPDNLRTLCRSCNSRKGASL